MPHNRCMVFRNKTKVEKRIVRNIADDPFSQKNHPLNSTLI